MFNDDGTDAGVGEIKGHDNFLDWLDQRTEIFIGCIVEEYTVRNQQFNHQGSKVPTIQLIGAIKRWAKKRNTPVYEQPSSALPIACRFAGVPYKKGVHVRDALSAYAHGVYWLQKKKIRKNRLAK